MFADTAKVSLKAGKGGDGAVSFRQEKYVPKGGPDGGDGGRGGDIIFRADKDTNTLVDFRFTPILTAENGRNGAGQRAAGRSGEDLILEVPIGTAIYRLGEGSGAEPERILLTDLTEDGQEVVVAHGGDGGFGNAHFKSSTRQAPTVAEVGEPGEEFEAELELKSVADVGLVGLPNAGKSTFLSVVSNATPEIADYPFTTLTPQLGVAEIDGADLLIADIPGLIEGAAEGRGLGHDFLRHVERTAVLLHLVDVYNNDAGVAYRTIRKELERYGDLAERPEVVALTKCEGVDREIVEMQMTAILAVNPEARVFAISASAHQGLTEVLRELKEVVQGLKERAQGLTEEVVKPEKTGRGSKKGAQGLTERAQGAEEGIEGTETQKSAQELVKGRGTRSGEQVGWRSGQAVQRAEMTTGEPTEGAGNWAEQGLPTISLSPKELNAVWKVRREGEKFIVTGEKIEKFARRTDLENYASVNRLRDILKKMGIRAELTNQGAKPDSVIEIAGKDFTLVEQ